MDLTGAKVTGSLVLVMGVAATRGGCCGSNNFFDPANKFVPSNYGNSAPNSPTDVAVLDNLIEFGYENAKSKITVDVSTRGFIFVKVDARRGLFWDAAQIDISSTTFSANVKDIEIEKSPSKALRPQTSLSGDTVSIIFPAKKADDKFYYTYVIELVRQMGLGLWVGA